MRVVDNKQFSVDDLVNFIMREFDDDILMRTATGRRPIIPVEMSLWVCITPADGSVAIELNAEYEDGNVATLVKFDSVEHMVGYATRDLID